MEVIEPDAMPQQPDWLTPEAEEVWIDDVGRVKLATESNSTLFANYCTLQGGILKAVRSGEMPPVAAFAEVRKLQETLGIAGARSRQLPAGLLQGTTPGGVFARNGRRS